MKSNSKLLTRRNVFLIILTYIIVAGYLTTLILNKANQAARTAEERITLMAVNLLVAAPGFSIGLLHVFLRTEYLLQTRDLSEFLFPQKGSLGNPNIDDIVGKRGLKFLNAVVIILIVLAVALFGWYAYSALIKPK